ncbi:uncharacterized protein FOMMEDRAFT_31757 [Fomitiporia mediterranea MF3/22]|uniref:uncharacterized protein n=1 Tax=Fomitiporia mediterranea (strain MF3/22) TaxID=694068 RepID=UPI0004409401|nr:uncharacterized protein FOMMEDRAFT_31757 [Fomitiporia mediterranea MF3/22]EJC98749.1 hypothetical protein FOMMEDRAFT_31757 [Fomitiporia mediterranea MF3/22]
MAVSTKDTLELINSIKNIKISAFYDYLLTLEDELRLIWRSEWSVPKAVFLITLYLPVIDLSITTAFHFRSATPGECLRTPVLIDFGHPNPPNMGNMGEEPNGNYRTLHMDCYQLWYQLCALYPPSQFCSLYTTTGWGILADSRFLTKEHEGKQLRNSSLFKAVFTNGAIFYVYIFAFSFAFNAERVTHAFLTERLFIALRRAAVHGTDKEDLMELETLRFQRNHKCSVFIDLTAFKRPPVDPIQSFHTKNLSQSNNYLTKLLIIY